MKHDNEDGPFEIRMKARFVGGRRNIPWIGQDFANMLDRYNARGEGNEWAVEFLDPEEAK